MELSLWTKQATALRDKLAQQEEPQTGHEAITYSALVEKLLALKGAEPITFTACTDSRCKAKENPFPRPIMKTSRVNGLVNFHYDKSCV